MLSKFWFGVVGLSTVIALALFFYPRFFPAYEKPVSELSATKNMNGVLYQSLQKQYDADIKRVQEDFKSGKISLNQAAQEKQALATTLTNRRVQVEHPAGNCGANEKREADRFSYDISGCEAGLIPPANLLDPWEEQIYSVRLYKLGQNKQLVPVVSEAVVKAAKDNHSEADKLGAAYIMSPSGTVAAFGTRYRLRGRISFVAQGDADYVEFVREP